MAEQHGSPTQATRTLAGARDHARQQAGSAAPSGPTVPAGTASDLPSIAAGSKVLWAETLELGGYASRRLPRGALLRVSDPLGDACVQLLVHNAAQPAERLNVADTVKVQWQAYLGTGALLLSDMGRVLMTIVDDTSERHDCLCGCSVRPGNDARYGDGGAAGKHPNGRDLLALGLAKFGLSRPDVTANINLFKSVRVDESGGLHLIGHVRPETHVDLRAEMDVLVTIANTPHPLDDRPVYSGTRVRCWAWIPKASGDSAEVDGGVRTSTPERARAFMNTDEYLLGVAT